MDNDSNNNINDRLAPDESDEIIKPTKSTNKKKGGVFGADGFRVWFIVLLVYVGVFGSTGYIAFWPQSFNDPEESINKYIVIVDEYERNNKDSEIHNYRPMMEDLMKKSDEASGDMQELASQSFNIVLGAFLAFLSATVTMIFQNSSNQKKESDE